MPEEWINAAILFRAMFGQLFAERSKNKGISRFAIETIFFFCVSPPLECVNRCCSINSLISLGCCLLIHRPAILSHFFALLNGLALNLFFCYSRVVNNVGASYCYFITLWYFDRSPYDLRTLMMNSEKMFLCFYFSVALLLLMTPVLTLFLVSASCPLSCVRDDFVLLLLAFL